MALFLPSDLCGVKTILLQRQPDAIEALSDANLNWIEQDRLSKLADQDHPDLFMDDVHLNFRGAEILSRKMIEATLPLLANRR